MSPIERLRRRLERARLGLRRSRLALRRAPLRLYRALLLLYPRRFREEFEDELVQGARDRAGEIRYGGLLGRIRLAGFLTADLVRSGSRVWFREWIGVNGRAEREGTAMRLADIGQDLRFAFRSFRRRPGFFGMATATLALGVGSTTAVFSVVDGVLLRPLPYEEPDRLVELGTRYEQFDGLASSSPLDVFDWQHRSRTLEAIAASRLERLTLLGRGEPRRVEGAGVSAAYFGVLAVEPAQGRAFTTSEDRPGAPPVAVLSHGFWRELGAEASILGRTLALDGRAFTVVGVMGEDFHPPEAIDHRDVDVWYPLAHIGDPLDVRDAGFLQVLGRLAPGVSLEAAEEELSALERSLAASAGRTGVAGVGVVPLQEATVGESGRTMVIVLGAVGLLLLIACGNVANLFLVRATEREREMAVRTSLGASRGRLVRQLLTESMAVGVVSAVLSALLALGAVEAFVAGHPTGLPRLPEVAVDLRVLGFAILLSLATGLLFGLVPALRGPGDGAVALRAGTRGGGGRGAGRVRGLLVIGQTAVALVLVVGAGLLVNSFVRLVRVDPGFRSEEVAWLEVRVPGEDLPTPEERIGFFGDIERRVASVPGVRATGATNNLPLSGNRNVSGISLEGGERAGDEPLLDVSWSLATGGYFETLGIPMLRGRGFTPGDGPDAPRVAVVSEALARRVWPGEDAVGHRFKAGPPGSDEPWTMVVGVVGDVHQRELDRAPDGLMYLPFAQAPRPGMYLVAHAAGEPADLLPVLRGAVWEAEPTLPLERGGDLADHVARSVVGPFFYTLLLSGFAAFALGLAFVGIYGTTAYTVEQRTHELGVRMALGAARRDVVGLVLKRGMALIGAGLALGLAGALASTRVLGGLVYGITPGDPATLAAVVAALAAVGLLASWLPARRAARVDPARSLRHE